MGFNEWNLTITGSDFPEDVRGVYLTTALFIFLVCRQRWVVIFLPPDAQDGQEPQPVVVLGNKF